MLPHRAFRTRLVTLAAAVQVCSAGHAQPASQAASPAAGSLQRTPQQGATPVPLQPRPAAPPAAPPVRAPAALIGPPPPVVTRPLLAPEPLAAGQAQPLPGRSGLLPAPTGDPLAVDVNNDPLLGYFEGFGPRPQFFAIVQAAVARNPARDEAEAQRDVAAATRSEARAGLFPVVDLSMTYFRVLSRDFSNNPNNILERQRPAFRTDAIARIQQPIYDFGFTVARIKAGNRRIDAAVQTINDSSAQIGLRAVSAWNLVFGYRALVRLADDYALRLGQLRAGLKERVDRGLSAPTDLAQIDSFVASSDTQAAQFRRQLASAEAQFQELTGSPSPPELGRVPPPADPPTSLEQALLDAETIPAVAAARLQAEAAGYDVKAARADALPGVTVGVDAGRYGVFENPRDYDIRGTATLSWRLFGGAAERTDGARARARGVDASYRRIREEASRDAAIAWADVRALEDARASIRANYIASLKSRDALVERFRASRGTPFEVLNTENNLYNVAVQYIQTVIELDTARYVLLARTGKLLDVLEIPSAQRKP